MQQMMTRHDALNQYTVMVGISADCHNVQLVKFSLQEINSCSYASLSNMEKSILIIWNSRNFDVQFFRRSE